MNTNKEIKSKQIIIFALIFILIIWIVVASSSIIILFKQIKVIQYKITQDYLLKVHSAKAAEPAQITITLGKKPVFIEPAGAPWEYSGQDETIGFHSVNKLPNDDEIKDYIRTDLDIKAIRTVIINRKGVQTGPDLYDWSVVDQEINALQANGYETNYNHLTAATFGWDVWCYKPPYPDRSEECIKGANEKNKCYPCNEQAYKDFIIAALKRYDGDNDYDDDGSVDGPILPAVTYWEIENEPNVQDYWRDTPEKYAELLRVAYETIKNNCSTCQVIFGGIGGGAIFDGSDTLTNNFYDDVFSWLSTDSENYCLTHNGCFDIFNFHHYGFTEVKATEVVFQPGSKVYGYRQVKDKIDNFNSRYPAFANKPIWITETATYTGDPSVPTYAPFQTEEEQAIDLVKRFIFPMSQGVDKIFWYEVKEFCFDVDCNYGFSKDQLVFNGKGTDDQGNREKKLSFYTLQLLVDKMQGRDSIISEIIQIDQSTENVFVYKFTNAGDPIYIAWWDWYEDGEIGDSKQVTLTLSDITTDQVLITEAVPNATTGAELNPANYPNFFTSFTQDIDNPSCTPDCSTQGQKVCSGNILRECGNWDADSCLEYQDTDCSQQNQVCYSGQCITPACFTNADCPDDSNDCTSATCQNPGQYNAVCAQTAKQCSLTSDNCCPAGCTIANDVNCQSCSSNSDCSSGKLCCSSVCATPACSQASNCSDGNSCTTDSCSNANSCNAACQHTTITTCTNNDSCCPGSCSYTNDNNCSEPQTQPYCGDGSCNNSETCSSCSADCGSCSGSPPPAQPPVAPTNLSITLTPKPSSGQAPLTGVDLTATVTGGSGANLSYTFYCSRLDSGTNITTPYDARYSNVSQTSKTATDSCNYAQAGNYSAKVIVQQGTARAEARSQITVTTPPASQAEIPAKIYTDGTLLTTETSDDIYVIKDNKRELIPNQKSFISFGYNMAKVETISEDEMSQITTVNIAMLDSDNDGLTNDQEREYDTDAGNPDTDSDGYSDYLEVTSGHNPLVAYVPETSPEEQEQTETPESEEEPEQPEPLPDLAQEQLKQEQLTISLNQSQFKPDETIEVKAVFANMQTEAVQGMLTCNLTSQNYQFTPTPKYFDINLEPEQISQEYIFKLAVTDNLPEDLYQAVVELRDNDYQLIAQASQEFTITGTKLPINAQIKICETPTCATEQAVFKQNQTIYFKLDTTIADLEIEATVTNNEIQKIQTIQFSSNLAQIKAQELGNFTITVKLNKTGYSPQTLETYFAVTQTITTIEKLKQLPAIVIYPSIGVIIIIIFGLFVVKRL